MDATHGQTQVLGVRYQVLEESGTFLLCASNGALRWRLSACSRNIETEI